MASKISEAQITCRLSKKVGSFVESLFIDTGLQSLKSKVMTGNPIHSIMDIKKPKHK
jgi:hypothetical protein